MVPLEITARLNGPICLPYAPLALDALLAWAVCQRDGIEPALRVQDMVPIEIPVQREPDGRFHMCSHGAYDVECREARWTNRRFPMELAQMLNPVNITVTKDGTVKKKLVGSILTAGGPSKSFRIPREQLHLKDDMIKWWCVGHANEIRTLLGYVLYLGKRRGVGLGEVREWSVRAADSWPGFPVLRNGKPLRPLPPDWPGLTDPEMGYSCITYPYWLAEEEQICAVPI